MWVGGNFLFGRDRSGNFSLLRSLGLRYGFRAEKIDPVRYRDFVVSSTRVRRLVTEGRVDEAARPPRALPLRRRHGGAPGPAAGRSIGFPTANLTTENELLPPQGVYATAVTIGRTVHRADHQHRRPADLRDRAARRRSRPMFSALDEDLYGRELRLAFVLRLRAEQTFPGRRRRWSPRSAPTAREAQALFDRLSP